MLDRQRGRAASKEGGAIAPIAVSRTRIVVGAIGLAIGALAYAIVKDSPAREATAPPTAAERKAVEAEIYRTGIPGRLQHALGNAFGGLWFEPSTLQLHVGVTSPASRQEAEALAGETALADNVTETPVRFTWRQLEQAQGRLDQQLADLFAQGKVTTGLAPDSNSVKIELSSSVPFSRRATVEQAAEEEVVSTSLSVEPVPQFSGIPAEKCGEFKFKNANCDPTITSGVTIHGEMAGGKLAECTAGPLLILKDRSTPAKATETFVLTAGHCIDNGEGNGKTWLAYNTKAGKNILGKSLEHLMPAPGKTGVDIGVIKIESKYWAPANDPPVEAHRAEWIKEAKVESPIVPVAKGAPPVKGTNACLSGQRSARQCGKIIEINQKESIIYTEEKPLSTVEGITVVKMETGKVGVGDSGGPLFAESEPETVLGHMVGIEGEEEEEENEIAWFHPLEFSLKELAKVKGEYELLTTSNKVRHKGGIGMGADHVVLTTSSNSMQKFTLMPAGTTIECTNFSIDNATIQSESTAVETIEFEPTLSKCENLLGQEVSFNAKECKYVLHLAAEKTSGTTDIECPAGKSMEYWIGLNCKYTIGTQTGLGTVTYKNTGSGSTQEIVVEPSVTGITSSKTIEECLWCPAASKEGTYTGNFTLTGEDSEGGHVGIFVG